jgi:hypothetical protein
VHQIVTEDTAAVVACGSVAEAAEIPVKRVPWAVSIWIVGSFYVLVFSEKQRFYEIGE